MMLRMAKLILVANWKNKPSSLREAGQLLTELRRKSTLYKKLQLFIAPPAAYYERVAQKIRGYAHMASQGFPKKPEGTHTGLVSAEILQNFGVRVAILGHSEERVLGETNADVAKKVRLAMKYGLTPLVCVGESERDPEGNHLEFIRNQLKQSLEGLKRSHFAKATRDKKEVIMIAYEPVWAIGKRAKDAVNPEGLTEMVIFIRRILSDMYGRKTAEQVPILYGGSVEPRNAEVLYRDTGVRGFLVGHESLNPKDFEQIAESLVNSR